MTTGVGLGGANALYIVNNLDGVVDLHPLLVQGAPQGVQLVYLGLCQAGPVLAEVVYIQASHILLISAHILQVCTAQAQISLASCRDAPWLCLWSSSSLIHGRHWDLKATQILHGPDNHPLIVMHAEGAEKARCTPAIQASKRLTISAISFLK